MKLLHLVTGAVALVAFLLTGQYMEYLRLDSGATADGARMMFRSRHIYLLLAGLVNLGVGAYFVRREGRRRQALQTVGSAFVVVSPALFIAAFFSEPQLPDLQRHFTLPAVVLLSAGTLFHAFSGEKKER
jgi:drug/metabolite transporter (DMT)-like permease